MNVSLFTLLSFLHNTLKHRDFVLAPIVQKKKNSKYLCCTPGQSQQNLWVDSVIRIFKISPRPPSYSNVQTMLRATVAITLLVMVELLQYFFHITFFYHSLIKILSYGCVKISMGGSPGGKETADDFLFYYNCPLTLMRSG